MTTSRVLARLLCVSFLRFYMTHESTVVYPETAAFVLFEASSSTLHRALPLCRAVTEQRDD